MKNTQDLPRKILWLPYKTSNRAAIICYDVPRIDDFKNDNWKMLDGGVGSCNPFKTWKEANGDYIMENGNCCTLYEAIEVPDFFIEEHKYILADMVCEEIGRSEYYDCNTRALKATRTEVVKKCLRQMKIKILLAST